MTRSLPWIVTALIVLVCAPAFAIGAGAADPTPTASMVASDSGFREENSTDPQDRTVDILAGGRVYFSYPSGTGEYNVTWDRGSLVPSTCTQTAGPVWGYGTTLPWWTQGPGWAGYCDFPAAGTYTFHSGVNPEAHKGTVVVHATGGTPTPTPTATPTQTATPAPTTARVSAKDQATPLRYWFQDAASTDTNKNTVTIQAGGKVTFDYPAGSNFHNVDFRTAAKPASCVKTKQSPTLPIADADTVAPMPDFAQPPGWEGECTFPTPGQYAFVCSTHPVEMTGTVNVVAATGEPTPTPTATPTQTPTATPTVVPTVAPARPGIVAHDNATPKNWFQDAASTDPADNSVSVAPGGTVDFSFPVGAGTTAHNVVFATAPSSCVQRTGAVVFPTAPPLPQFALPPGWSGECTFNEPGTYTFICSTHPTEMNGSVVVGGGGAEPTPVPTPVATPEPPRDTQPGKVPRPWAAVEKPKTSQMTVAKFLDNKLTVTSRCVSAGSGTMTMTVNNQLAAKRLKVKARKRQSSMPLAEANATCNQYGRFTVKLKPNAQARKALKGYTGSLTVTLTLRLAGPIGSTTATRTVTLKGTKAKKGRK